MHLCVSFRAPLWGCVYCCAQHPHRHPLWCPSGCLFSRIIYYRDTRLLNNTNLKKYYKTYDNSQNLIRIHTPQTTREKQICDKGINKLFSINKSINYYFEQFHTEYTEGRLYKMQACARSNSGGVTAQCGVRESQWVMSTRIIRGSTQRATATQLRAVRLFVCVYVCRVDGQFRIV